MTKKELEDCVMTLLGVARWNNAPWREHFTDREIDELREMWNSDLSAGSDGYWYEGDN